MSRTPASCLAVYGMKCCVLRAAAVDASASLADALLPPQGDESLRPQGEKERKVRGTHSCCVVQHADTRILIDAGLQSSVVAAALQAAHIAPESIDLILLTHGDHDHIGALADSSGQLMFPNARLVMHEALWEAWTSDGQRGDSGAFYDDDQRSLVKALVPQLEGHVQTVCGTSFLGPGVRYLSAPGHRASHLAFEIRTAAGALLFLGDAIAFPEILEDLSRGVSFDSDPRTAIESRRRMLALAAGPDTVTFIPHFPFPGLGRIVQDTDCYSWSPLEP